LQEKAAEFFSSGARVKKCPPKAVGGGRPHRKVLEGSFYPVRR